MQRIALVVGATGGIGGETARALLAAGFRVRALARHPERAKSPYPGAITWVKGDALNPEDVIAAAEGVSVLVHAVNPPGYKNWGGLVLPMLESSIRAAERAGARLVLPGTVYNFGPDVPERVDESAPQNPRTPKGKLRVAMEQRIREATRAGMRALIVRAGDFFGPNTSANSWFGSAMVKPGTPLKKVVYPGRPDAGHAWAYLPDLARTIALLLARERELQPFEAFHFAGHAFERGIELAEATRRVAGVPNAPIRRFPWPVIHLLTPFSETLRGLVEMRYLWERSLLLDNRKLVAFLGEEPHTPLDEALAATLQGLGCNSPARASEVGPSPTTLAISAGRFGK